MSELVFYQAEYPSYKVGKDTHCYTSHSPLFISLEKGALPNRCLKVKSPRFSKISSFKTASFTYTDSKGYLSYLSLDNGARNSSGEFIVEIASTFSNNSYQIVEQDLIIDNWDYIYKDVYSINLGKIVLESLEFDVDQFNNTFTCKKLEHFTDIPQICVKRKDFVISFADCTKVKEDGTFKFQHSEGKSIPLENFKLVGTYKEF